MFSRSAAPLKSGRTGLHIFLTHSKSIGKSSVESIFPTCFRGADAVVGIDVSVTITTLSCYGIDVNVVIDRTDVPFAGILMLLPSPYSSHATHFPTVLLANFTGASQVRRRVPAPEPECSPYAWIKYDRIYLKTRTSSSKDLCYTTDSLDSCQVRMRGQLNV